MHEHCGESGAIGAAIEAHRLWTNGRRTSFIGLEAVQKITYSSHRNENTRCYFCKNKCLRTFIDVKLSPADDVENLGSKTSKIPILPGVKRLIVGNSCERGLVEDVNAMREIKKGMDAMKGANPNMAEVAAKAAFRSWLEKTSPPDRTQRYAEGKQEQSEKQSSSLRASGSLASFAVKSFLSPFMAKQKARREARRRRAELRIGIPRVLNQYSVNPLFGAYFEVLESRPRILFISTTPPRSCTRLGQARRH